MRRSFAALLMVVALAGGATACAHPHEVPRPGESPKPTPAKTTATTATVTSSGTDQTAAVCSEVKTYSNTAISAIKSSLATAQQAYNSKDTAAALIAYNSAKATAKDWAAKLDSYQGRNVKAQVSTVLQNGSTTIKALANAAPTSIDPVDAQNKLNTFLSDLDRACP